MNGDCTPAHPADDTRPAGVPSQQPAGGHGRDDTRAPAPGGAPDAPERPDPEDPTAEPADDPRATAPTGRQRLARALWPPRVSRAQLIVAVLLCGLGFGLATQVASTSDHSPLRGARQEDLVRILDELGDRKQRLTDEKQSLEKQRTELENSSDRAEEARRQTEEKERELGVLAGTVAATGPGIILTIEDTKNTVGPELLLDAIQELRAAGAEAIQVDDVRIVVNSYVTSGSGGGISVDGHRLRKPYRFKVIGKPEDLEPALNIPGGVVQTLQREQAVVTVERASTVIVDALRPAERPDYARSSS